MEIPQNHRRAVTILCLPVGNISQNCWIYSLAKNLESLYGILSTIETHEKVKASKYKGFQILAAVRLGQSASAG